MVRLRNWKQKNRLEGFARVREGRKEGGGKDTDGWRRGQRQSTDVHSGAELARLGLEALKQVVPLFGGQHGA